MSYSPSVITNRNRYLDFLKGILIVGMVFGHVLQYIYYRGDLKCLSDVLFKSLYLWHMPLFMGVAGYLSWNGIKRDSLGKLAWSRFNTYIVPVFAWAFVYTATRAALPSGAGLAGMPSDFFHNSFMEFWFLWALFISTLLAGIAHVVGRKLMLLYVFLPLLFLLLPDVWHLNLTKYVMPFFMLGCLVAQHGVPPFFKQQSSAVLIVTLFVSLVCLWEWRDDTYVYLSGSLFRRFGSAPLVLRYTAGLGGSLSVLLIVWKLWERAPAFISDPIEAMGRDSIFIFLAQCYLFLHVGALLARSPVLVLNVFERAIGGLALALLISGTLWLLCTVLARNALIARLFFGKRRVSPRTSASLVPNLGPNILEPLQK